MDIYSLTNQKGGVGKTTSTVNLGAALAAAGERVLLIDLDPQGHLTDALDVEPAPKGATLRTAMCAELLDEAAVRALPAQAAERLNVIPTNLDMALLEIDLMPMLGREFKLADVLEVLEDDYDVCLIDAPPSLNILTGNALYAARKRDGRRGGVITPVQALDSSIKALDLLIAQIRSVKRGLRIDLDFLGLIVNAYDARRGSIATSTLDHFSSLAWTSVLAVIGERADITKAWRAGKTVLDYAPDSEAAGWFRDLAKTIRAAA
jgi:chromosome partitioning protein